MVEMKMKMGDSLDILQISLLLQNSLSPLAVLPSAFIYLLYKITHRTISLSEHQNLVLLDSLIDQSFSV